MYFQSTRLMMHQDLIKENVFGIDTNLEITCDVCGEDISGQVGSSDFF